MSNPTQFVIAHASDKPIDKQAFIRASNAVSSFLRLADVGWLHPIKPGWGCCEDLIHFGGNPFKYDRQTSFCLARDPAEYRKEDADYPVQVSAMTPSYTKVVEMAIALINYHTGNALVVSRDGKLVTPRSKRDRRVADLVLA